MRKQVLVILLVLVFAAGCAKTAKIRRTFARETVSKEIADAKPSFTVGERFTYLIAWKGIPVGQVTATIKELTSFKGYEVYNIVVVGRTNKILDKLFKVEDTFITYMDKNKLISRHYEGVHREGRYRKHVIVDYDFENCIATYRNLQDGSVKTCPIEKDVQDPVSAAYFARTIPVRIGEEIKQIVNVSEKNYEVHIRIKKRAKVTLPKLGTFDAFLVKPYVKLDGKKEKKAKVWGYVSTDKKRLCLFWVIKILAIPCIGEITATLEKVEYLQDRTPSTED